MTSGEGEEEEGLTDGTDLRNLYPENNTNHHLQHMPIFYFNFENCIYLMHFGLTIESSCFSRLLEKGVFVTSFLSLPSGYSHWTRPLDACV